ncbi:MAG: phage tail protein [Anaerolineae bacterium]
MAGRQDPLITPRFIVKFGNKLQGSFQECTVVSAEHEPAEYKFSDDKGEPGYYAVPGRMKFGRITLKRGLTGDMSAWKWRQEVEEGKIKTARTNGSILMCDQDGTPIAEYNFENAWPLKVSGPAPNANTSDLAREEVEIITEKMWRKS